MMGPFCEPAFNVDPVCRAYKHLFSNAFSPLIRV